MKLFFNRYGNAFPKFYQEGLEDGRTIANLYECNSLEVRSLRINLEQLFEKRQNAIPEKDDFKRWKRLMNPLWQKLLGNKPPRQLATRSGLLNACLKATDYYRKDEWCNCIVRRILASSLSNTDKINLQSDWDSTIQKLYDESEIFNKKINDPCRM